MGGVVSIRPRSYEAKPVRLFVSGLEIQTSGTLDGFIDFAVIESNGKSATYLITCEDARRIIAGLNSVISDIQTNCLFDRDPLLAPL